MLSLKQNKIYIEQLGITKIKEYFWGFERAQAENHLSFCRGTIDLSQLLQLDLECEVQIFKDFGSYLYVFL